MTTGESADGVSVNAKVLWAGGAATALVAALIRVIGILLCTGIFGIAAPAPGGNGAWEDADLARYAGVAALAALVATGVEHLLLLYTARPGRFFGWLMMLATLAAALAPLAGTGGRASQLATMVINVVVGIAIGTLVSGSGRAAVRPASPPTSPPSLPPPYRVP